MLWPYSFWAVCEFIIYLSSLSCWNLYFPFAKLEDEATWQAHEGDTENEANIAYVNLQMLNIPSQDMLKTTDLE